MEKYRVTLTAEERAQLEHTVSVGKGAARKLAHARILLLADTSKDQGLPDEDIIAALGTSLRTVERVRRRLVTQGLPAALDPRPQPPRPDKIKRAHYQTVVPRRALASRKREVWSPGERRWWHAVPVRLQVGC